MSDNAIFWPMLVHAALVFGLYAFLLLRRAAAVRGGSTTVAQFRENRNEPVESLFVRNSLANQFELPLLFYAACLSLHALGSIGTTALTVAWIFSLSRIVHAVIHVTSNRIRHRQPAFVVGFVAVVILWLMLAIRLAAA